MDLMLTIFGVGGPLILAAALVAGGLFFGLPRRAALLGALAAGGYALVKIITRKAIKADRMKQEIEDHENAQDIADRASRSDLPDELRKYEGRGYRDGE